MGKKAGGNKLFSAGFFYTLAPQNRVPTDPATYEELSFSH
jgi:hypothetical protein